MIAVTQAAAYLKNERLIDCAVYATIEPCAMCAGAMVLARVKRLVYGASDPKAGACGSVINIACNNKLNHKIEVIPGILEQESAALLKEFFKGKRNK
jgi:tRNA(adenine34) deaminase